MKNIFKGQRKKWKNIWVVKKIEDDGMV